MKSSLVALTLLSSAGLVAENAAMEITKVSNQSSCCSTCCCTPCCCKPQPTVCVSGVAYTVPYYDLQCDWGAFIDVEFLYWYARETDLSYAAVVTNQLAAPNATDSIQGITKFKALDAKWDPGFRVGLGWNSECDGWDLFLHYTWMRNKKTDSTKVPTIVLDGESSDLDPVGPTVLINPWVSQSASAEIFLLDYFSEIRAKWRLQWNVLDLELGRKYWLSPSFNLRPYIGVRGAWWKTRFRTTSTADIQIIDTESQTTPVQGYSKDRFTSRTWGVGLIGGLQPTWYLSCCFALYANMDISLIWGDKKNNKRESISRATTRPMLFEISNYSNRSKYKFAQMTPILDTSIGIRWEDTWCCDRYRTALDLGWEHHIYFDQNHRIKSIDTAQVSGGTGGGLTQVQFRTYGSESGNIGLGGFVLRARFDF